MKRLVFIVEGYSELEFIDKLIRPYFAERHQFYQIEAFCIRTSTGNKGGFGKYKQLKDDIQRIIRDGNTNVIITTFLDFFRLPNSVPQYQIMLKESDIDKKITILEDGFSKDIKSDKFIPYIQKHEFEALLFSDNCGFEELYEKKIYTKTQAIIEAYPNPEEINNNPDTSPSKRLIHILNEDGDTYDKVTEGNLIAEDVGITKMLEKCPRFKTWIKTLVERVIETKV